MSVNMKLPYHIQRSRWKTAIFMFGGGGMFILWILGITGFLDIEGMDHIVFILFALLFLLPMALYFGFLTFDRTPLVTMYDDKIVFHSHFHPWCQYTIPRDKTISCSTDWEGLNSESRCDLIFRVHPELLQSYRKNHFIRKKGHLLYFEFSIAEVNAFKGVELMNEYLKSNK